MTILLDTHVLLFWLQDSPRLSPKAREIMADGQNVLLWSAASSFELAVKVGLGRVRLPEALSFYLPERLADQGVSPLPIENAHALKVAELPRHHADPFDRLLIAQSLVEGVPILSDDRQLRAYGDCGVETVW